MEIIHKTLINNGYTVVGIDNLNDYYDPQVKLDRLQELDRFALSNDLSANYVFQKIDLKDIHKLDVLFEKNKFDVVVNLAAQAGVRYSIENPQAYVDSNLVGFTNILESCRKHSIGHLVFASSSSVYGMNIKQPFSTSDNTDCPVSLYAATKKSNEVLAHSYSHLYKIPITGLRFFTVYGPYGRPDMAYYSFTKSIVEGKPINVFNHGEMKRDFTYIDDIVDGLVRVISKVPVSSDNSLNFSTAPFKIYNLGNNNPVSLKYFIELIEKLLSKKAEKNNMPMQDGDVLTTYADIDELAADIGYQPKTSIEEGLKNFINWYLNK